MIRRIKENEEQQWQEVLTRAIDRTQFADVETPATPDQEYEIEHGLRFIPLGFIVTNQDKAAVTYKGVTAWDTEKIYLKTDTATVMLRVLIF